MFLLINENKIRKTLNNSRCDFITFVWLENIICTSLLQHIQKTGSGSLSLVSVFVSASCKVLHWTQLSTCSAHIILIKKTLTAHQRTPNLYWAFIELSDARKRWSCCCIARGKTCVLVSRSRSSPSYNWVKVKTGGVQEIPCRPALCGRTTCLTLMVSVCTC